MFETLPSNCRDLNFTWRKLSRETLREDNLTESAWFNCVSSLVKMIKMTFIDININYWKRLVFCNLIYTVASLFVIRTPTEFNVTVCVEGLMGWQRRVACRSEQSVPQLEK